MDDPFSQMNHPNSKIFLSLEISDVIFDSSFPIQHISGYQPFFKSDRLMELSLFNPLINSRDPG